MGTNAFRLSHKKPKNSRSDSAKARRKASIPAATAPFTVHGRSPCRLFLTKQPLFWQKVRNAQCNCFFAFTDCLTTLNHSHFRSTDRAVRQGIVLQHISMPLKQKRMPSQNTIRSIIDGPSTVRRVKLENNKRHGPKAMPILFTGNF